METTIVDNLQQKIDSIADLIHLQSKEFNELIIKERAEREKEHRAYIKRLKKERAEKEKERAERENALEKERAEKEKERAERERLNKVHDERLEKERKEYLNRLKKLEGNWTTFTESLIKPGIIDLFFQYGIRLHNIYTNVIFHKENNEPFYEIDLLLTNDHFIVLVEIKTKLTIQNVQDHLKRIVKVQNHPHKDFNWKNRTIIGCVAGITADESTINFAIKNGLFVLVQKGHLVEMVNENPFKFKTWDIR